MGKPTEAEKKKWHQAMKDDVAKDRAPNFDLAPLTRWPKETFLPASTDDAERADLKRVALTLGLIFNDMKDLSWAWEILGYWPPPDPKKIEPYVGQHGSMRTCLFRHIAGVLAELGHVIKAKRDLFDSSAFKAASAHLKQRRPLALASWEAVLAAFEREEPAPGERHQAASPVVRCMEFVRDKAAYHYGHKSFENLGLLSAAYAKHFTTDSTDERYRVAFASLGESMESSRFYFADAAIGCIIDDALKAHAVGRDALEDFLHNVNFALRFVVEALFNYLAATASKAPVNGQTADSAPRKQGA